MAIEHIKASAAQDSPDCKHTLDEIDRPIHWRGMYRKAFVAQALDKLRLRLADRLEMMTAIAHGQQHPEYILLLPAKPGRRLGMQYAQGSHEYLISTPSGSAHASNCSSMTSAIRTRQSSPRRSVQ